MSDATRIHAWTVDHAAYKTACLLAHAQVDSLVIYVKPVNLLTLSTYYFSNRLKKECAAYEILFDSWDFIHCVCKWVRLVYLILNGLTLTIIFFPNFESLIGFNWNHSGYSLLIQ